MPASGRTMAEADETFVGWDHLAFRSFDRVDGGLRAVARVFEHGTRARGWSGVRSEKGGSEVVRAPPGQRGEALTRGGDPAFPRLFVSHLRVDDLPDDARKVIERSVGTSESRSHRDARAAAAPASDALVGQRPRGLDVVPSSLDEYETLSNASEYAAWTLVHGHALNHVAVAVHRLFEREGASRDSPPRRRFASLEACLAFLKAPPHLSTKTSRAGGREVKVSPDGGLRQAATVADVLEFGFMSNTLIKGDPRGVAGVDARRTKTLVQRASSRMRGRLPMLGPRLAGGGSVRPRAPAPGRLRNRKRGRHLRIHVRAQQRDG